MEKQSVCPWWMGYFLLLPIRKFTHNPQKILKPYIEEGMKVVDYGSGMGYFSLDMAKLVGSTGRVVCLDIQDKMLDGLMARAEKANIEERIKPLLITKKGNLEYLKEQIDFTLLFAVAHEIPDQKELFQNIAKMLKPKGKVLFSEPKGHVSPEAFKASIKIAMENGFEIKESVSIKGGLSVLLEKE